MLIHARQEGQPIVGSYSVPLNRPTIGLQAQSPHISTLTNRNIKKLQIAETKKHD
jgi:hypothetical protein